jgi:hypothetical protein
MKIIRRIGAVAELSTNQGAVMNPRRYLQSLVTMTDTGIVLIFEDGSGPAMEPVGAFILSFAQAEALHLALSQALRERQIDEKI